jgi:hypothetical protein
MEFSAWSETDDSLGKVAALLKLLMLQVATFLQIWQHRLSLCNVRNQEGQKIKVQFECAEPVPTQPCLWSHHKNPINLCSVLAVLDGTLQHLNIVW